MRTFRKIIAHISIPQIWLRFCASSDDTNQSFECFKRQEMKISWVVSRKPSRRGAAIEMQEEHTCNSASCFLWTWRIDLRHQRGKKGCLLWSEKVRKKRKIIINFRRNWAGGRVWLLHRHTVDWHANGLQNISCYQTGEEFCSRKSHPRIGPC